ncbi:hypothetical protein [Xanthobacter sp. KR7-225]|uniref:hypothetical protein n=1 Tax=Xanthobacter sp. KR7-225 TaxID=3156613 RepID=UPI0032B59501
MDMRVKLPVRGTIMLALRWTWAIARHHWLFLLAYTLIPGVFMAVIFGSAADFALIPAAAPSASWIALDLAIMLADICVYVALAVLTHNEVEHGLGSLTGLALGGWIGRAFGYVFDFLLLFLGVSLLTMIGLAAMIGLLMIGRTLLGPAAIQVPLFISPFVFMAAYVAVLARLVLRLPTRALGHPMPWSEVWSMGRGNTLRLLACGLLVVLLLVAVTLPVELPLLVFYLPLFPFPDGPPAAAPFSPGAMYEQFAGRLPFVLDLAVSLYFALVNVIAVILHCSVLSIAYGHLREGLDDPYRGFEV